MKRLITLLILACMVLSGSSLAGRVEKVTEVVEIEGADEVVINCDLGAGEFTIRPKEMGEVAIVDIIYDTRRIDYNVSAETKRNRRYVELESEHRRSGNIDTEDNLWDITLSTKYPTTLEMDIGACDAEFDLGGLKLKEVTLDIGAASGLITFSKPNPIRLEEFDVDAGASSLTIEMIGNANFDYFSIDGGAGSFELDFRGKYDGESRISLDIGLGSADIVLPEGVPVRIETEGDNWLSSVDIHGKYVDEVDEDVYESDDFDRSDTRIIVDLSVGLGSVDIYFK